MAGEAAGDGLAVAEFEEAIAYGVLGSRGRVVGDGKCRGKRVGEAVVSVDAGDFFDQIDLTLEVETPGGQGDLVDIEAVEK